MNTDAEKLNFTDNFNADHHHNLEVYQNGKHSPINERKTNSSDTESQLAAYGKIKKKTIKPLINFKIRFIFY